MFTLFDLRVSSLRRGHANLLCVVPILTDDPRRESRSETKEMCGNGKARRGVASTATRELSNGDRMKHTGVCEINALFDSGVYKIGLQFCLKRIFAIPPGLRVMGVPKAHKAKHRNQKKVFISQTPVSHTVISKNRISLNVC